MSYIAFPWSFFLVCFTLIFPEPQSYVFSGLRVLLEPSPAVLWYNLDKVRQTSVNNPVYFMNIAHAFIFNIKLLWETC